jgi:hypothetical protein
MQTIGRKFFEPFETLDNEKVIWEGGPSRRGFWPQFFEYFGIGLVFFLIIWFFTFAIFMSIHSTSSSANNKENTTIQSQQDSVANDDSIAAKKEVKKVKFPLKKDIAVNLILLAVFVLLALFFAWKRYNSYWYVVTSERVCIQNGLFERKIVTIDLDKVISIKTSQSIFERLFKVNSVELVHGGVTMLRNYFSFINNPNTMKYLDIKENIAGMLINEWLPRDNIAKNQ